MNETELRELAKQLQQAWHKASDEATLSAALQKGKMFGAYFAIAYILGAMPETKWQKFLRGTF